MPPYRHGRALIAVLAALMLMTMGAATATAAVQPPTGGPILLVTSSADPFGSYDSEILRNEGFNDFAVVDVSDMAAKLAGHDTVILAQTALSDAQVATLTTWVQGGGTLIAMRPDKKLAPLLGLSDTGVTLTNSNLQIDTTQAPGAGITASPLQFHGTADLYTLAGARAVATLTGGSPAVSLRNVGAGHAAAFTYDLARSIVYTRQGNPSWAGQNRDWNVVGDNPDPVVRSDDLFFGGDPDDVQPDWVDLSRVSIPQADEQQRLLANMVVQLSITPTPRFAYFPHGDKAVLALTGDDHGAGHTNDVFDHMYDLGSTECKALPTSQAVLDSWTCPRGTSYLYSTNSPIEPQVAANWDQYGFELGPHPMMQHDGSCVDFTPTTLTTMLDNELATFAQKFPNVAAPTTVRTHCITWSDWSSQPKADLAHGIRLNTDYYYFPGQWTQDHPGMFTGSGMPMRFADCDGSLIDVYQATTYAADDATLDNANANTVNTFIETAGKALIDGALGTNGYYGAFTIQVHTDEPTHDASRDALIAYAELKNVPMVSERQLLRWLDARNASSFENISYAADGKLTFTVNQAAGADGLQAMIPAQGLTALKHDGDTVSIEKQTIKGVEYAILPDASGDYVATYPAPAVAHVASSFSGSIAGGNGGAGACEDAGNPGGNPGGGDPGGNPGGGNPGGGNPGGGNTGGGNTTGTHTVITEAGPVAAASAKTTKVPPFASAGASRFRPGSKRTFVLTVRLRKTSRLVLTIRDKHGKVVRTIKVPKRKAGTTVRVRWDGKDRHGHYVSAATYRYALTAIGNHYLKTARGSVAVLRAG
jgi:hypothetical protein